MERAKGCATPAINVLRETLSIDDGVGSRFVAFSLSVSAMMLAILDGLKVMKVIVAGYIDFENAGEVREILTSARPHIEGALEEEGCIAYSWTECHLTPGRVYVLRSGHHLRRYRPTLPAIGIETWADTLHHSPESRVPMYEMSSKTMIPLVELFSESTD